MAGMLGEWTAPPVWGVMGWRRHADGSVSEVAPTRCPRGHELGARRIGVSFCTQRRLRQYTCWACYGVDAGSASWCPAPSPIPGR